MAPAKSWFQEMIGENARYRRSVQMCSVMYLARLASTPHVNRLAPYSAANSSSERSRRWRSRRSTSTVVCRSVTVHLQRDDQFAEGSNAEDLAWGDVGGGKALADDRGPVDHVVLAKLFALVLCARILRRGGRRIEIAQRDCPGGHGCPRVAARGATELGLGHVDDRADAEGHRLHGHGFEPVARALLVDVVERPNHLADLRGPDLALWGVDERCFERLTDHPAVEAAVVGRAGSGIADLSAHLGLEFRVGGVDQRGGLRCEEDRHAAALHEDHVRAEQPERREQAGMRRHDDPPRLDLVKQCRQKHGPSGTVRDEREVARVDAVADDDVEDAFGDVVQADLERVVDPLLDRQPRVQVLERLQGQLLVEAGAAAQESFRIKDSDQQAGVRHRWVGTAASVGGRPRVCSGAGRPNADLAAGSDCDEASAAGADTRDLVRERADDEIVLELDGVVDQWATIDHDGNVRRRPTDVAADEVLLADEASEVRGRRRAGGRSGEDHPRRTRHRRLHRREHRRTVAEVQRSSETEISEACLQALGVRAVDDAHDGVDRGRRHPPVLPREGGDAVRRDAGDIAELLTHEFGHPLFVLTVDPPVQQADGDTFDVASPEYADLVAGLLLVERDEDRAVAVQAFAYAATQVARDERSVRVTEGSTPARVGDRFDGTPAVPDVEDIAMTEGGQQPDLRKPPRQQRVQAVRARMVEHRGVRDADLIGAAQDAGG